MYYKLGQACVTNWGSFVLLQIRANVATNWGSFIITNQGKCSYELGQLLQIRATVITKQGSYYKLGQNVLQIGAGITNQGNYYKLGYNNYHSRINEVASNINNSDFKFKEHQEFKLLRWNFIFERLLRLFFFLIGITWNS